MSQEVRLELKAIDAGASATVASTMGKATSSVQKLRDETSKLDRETRRSGDAVNSLKGAWSALIGLGVVSYLRSAAGAFAQSEAANARLNAVLRSTKGVAGVTGESVKAFAAQMQKLTVYEDDAVVGAQAVMLTFTRVGKEVFPQAMKAALDMSAAFGQDLQGSVIQLGKALNDPIQGISALSRAGVQFTDQQENQIKVLMRSGDLLGAQKVILKELETQVGGTAEEVGNSVGPFAKFKNELGDLSEDVGKALVPAVVALRAQFQKLKESGQIDKFVNAVGTGFKFLATHMDEVVLAGETLLTLWAGQKAVAAISSIANIASALRVLPVLASASLGPIGAVVALAGGLAVGGYNLAQAGEARKEAELQSSQTQLKEAAKAAELQSQNSKPRGALNLGIKVPTMNANAARDLTKTPGPLIKPKSELSDPYKNYIPPSDKESASKEITMPWSAAMTDKYGSEANVRGKLQSQRDAKVIAAQKADERTSLAAEARGNAEVSGIKAATQMTQAQSLSPSEGRDGAMQEAQIAQVQARLEAELAQEGIHEEKRKALKAQSEAEISAIKTSYTNKAKADETAALQASLQVAGNLFGGMAALAQQWNLKNRSARMAYKTFAIAQATMETAAAAISAYKSTAAIPVVGPVLAIPAAAAAAAFGIAKVNEIRKQQFRTGGFTGHGPDYAEAGTVHRNEYVVPAPDVRRLGGSRGVENALRNNQGNTTSISMGGINVTVHGTADPQMVVDSVKNGVSQGMAEAMRMVENLRLAKNAGLLAGAGITL